MEEFGGGTRKGLREKRERVEVANGRETLTGNCPRSVLFLYPSDLYPFSFRQGRSLAGFAGTALQSHLSRRLPMPRLCFWCNVLSVWLVFDLRLCCRFDRCRLGVCLCSNNNKP